MRRTVERAAPGPRSGSLDARLVVPGRLDLSFGAAAGSVIAVVGPNGAGKSTLLHALAGLQPAQGHVHLDGVDLGSLETPQRGTGVVFQDQRLFPHLSALDNVAFGPQVHGVARAQAREVARPCLARLQVADLADRGPDRLSGGQAQRVAIARALATSPALLLLDEPFAGLDLGVAAALRIELAEHLRTFDGTTVLVTHDPLDARTLADEVLVLDQGRLVQSGPPEEIAARPRSEHAARLMGLNVVREGASLRAFSPSAVAVSHEAPVGSARDRWRGVNRSAAPRGDAVRLQVDTDPPLLADVTPETTREMTLTPGRTVWLSVKETATRCYPAEAGVANR